MNMNDDVSEEVLNAVVMLLCGNDGDKGGKIVAKFTIKEKSWKLK